MKTLYVFALEAEAKYTREIKPCHIWITGVGKVNAAYHMTKAIMTYRGDIGHVVNLGTAASGIFEPGSIYQCNRFKQADMDCKPLGFWEGVTPFDVYGESILETVLLDIPLLVAGYCSTADRFVENPAGPLVDMEAYSLAKVCRMLNVNFTSIKYVSDNGGSTDWENSINDASRALADVVKLLDAIA